MDSPLGPTSGHVHMCCFENISLEDCPPHLKPIVCNRQFIDIFLLFRSKNHAKKFKNYHNKQPKKLSKKSFCYLLQFPKSRIIPQQTLYKGRHSFIYEIIQNLNANTGIS